MVMTRYLILSTVCREIVETYVYAMLCDSAAITASLASRCPQ
jgi:hypothetical protein